MNILNNKKITSEDIKKIEAIQENYNVIDNYKLFKDILILNK